MFTLELFGKSIDFDKKIKLSDLDKNREYLCAKVNNRLRELDYYVDYDAVIEFLDETDFYGMKIYESTLRYVILMALKRLYPNDEFRFLNTVSRSFLLVSADSNKCLTSDLLEELIKEVNNLIAQDIKIDRHVITIDEAKNLYQELKFNDKVDLLKYRKNPKVNVYAANDYCNYLYSYMAPSTGYLKEYVLNLYNPGIIVSYPRSDIKGKIPEFEPNISFDSQITKSTAMAEALKLDSVFKINEFILKYGPSELVNISENIHSRELVYLCDILEKNIRNIKLILVAGPSSSGKTTFTNRIRTELVSRGIVPTMISLDNYYKTREETPRDEDGQLDFESIYALDIDRFNQDILGLINGEEVSLREYDFDTKTIIEHGRKVKLKDNSPIMIEGIHALNDALHGLVPKQYKYKIYISPVLSLNLDEHTPINISDMRLLRRIVRDRKYRSTNPCVTFKMWDSVRKGEFKWIYPNADNVDYVFNSSLFYELAVMKKFAVDALTEVEICSEHFIDANRLLKFLRYLVDIDDKYVPANSLLREFIGGSSY